MDEFIQVINCLRGEKSVLPNYLADLLGVTTKTLSRKIEEINIFLKEEKTCIRYERNEGYFLDIEDEAIFKCFMKKYIEKMYHEIPDNDTQRVFYVINKLLKTNDYIKRAEFAVELFVSEKTISNVLTTIDKILKTYDLKLDRKPNYGLKIIGSEFLKRQCIINHLIITYDKFETNDYESSFVDYILKISKEKHLQFSEISFLNLLHYIGVCCNRINRGFIIEEKPDYCISNEMYDISKCIFKILQENEFITSYNDAEMYYLALFLKGDRITNNQILVNTVIPGNLEKLVNELFDFIDKQFDIDLSSNLEMRLYLLRHLVSLDVRMRYDIQIGVSLPDEYSKKYPFAYMIAKQSSFIFENYYKKQFNEEEIYLLSLFYEIVFESNNNNSKKLNILLVCPTGKIGSLLLKMNLQNEFSDYIGNIEMRNVFDLKNVNYEDFDYIFTTTPIDVVVSVPIIVISDIEGQLNTHKVKDTIQSNDMLRSVTEFYSKELFFKNVNCISKEEAIDFIINEIKKHYSIKENTKDLFLQRELLGTTDFVDDVAMLHPLQPLAQENIVCVVVLNKPVFWGKRKIQLIIMSSTYNSKDKLLKKFVESTANFVFNNESVKKVIENPNYSTFINELLYCSRKKK